MNIDLKHLRELCEQATPGPWTFVRHTCRMDGTHSETDDWSVYGAESADAKKRCICFEGNNPSLVDPEYIAAANPMVMLALLDIIEQRGNKNE